MHNHNITKKSLLTIYIGVEGLALTTKQSMNYDRNSPDALSSFAEITNMVSMTSSHVGKDKDTANENPVDNVSYDNCYI